MSSARHVAWPISHFAGGRITIYDNSATTGDGTYRVYGTAAVMPPPPYPGVQYTNNQEYVEPPP